MVSNCIGGGLLGGRGASSYTSKLKNRYGSQYHTLLTAGNVKFVEKTGKGSETLMETMTPGRVYAQVDRGKVKSIVYFDTEGKRVKQIDFAPHKGKTPHVHHGYLHNEYSASGEPTGLTPKETKLVESVLSTWENRPGK